MSCQICNGSGFIKNNKRTIACSCQGKRNKKTDINYQKCNYCGGLGYIPGCCGTQSTDCPACGKGWNMNDKIITSGVILGVIFLIFLVPFVAMICWNYIMPYLFNLKPVNYLQSVALLTLAWLLFVGPKNSKN